VDARPGRSRSSPLAFVAEQNSAAVGVANTAANTVAGTVPVGTYPDGLAASKDGSRVYVANFGQLCVGDRHDDTRGCRYRAYRGADLHRGVAQGSRAYVCNQGSQTISVINTKTDKVIGSYGVRVRQKGSPSATTARSFLGREWGDRGRVHARLQACVHQWRGESQRRHDV